MMNPIKCTVLAIVLVTKMALSVNAQLVNDMLNTGNNIRGLMLDNLREINLYGDPAVKHYEGSPYQNDDFKKGTVQKNNSVYTNLDLRYNIFDDWVEFKRDDRAMIIDPDHQIGKVEIGDDNYVVKRYDFKGKAQWGFLLELNSGKASLYAKSIVSFREAREPKALEAEGTPAEYLRLADTFYFEIGDESIAKVTNIKKMIHGFPDKQEELNAFAKKNKISPKRAEDLIKLFQYYNSL
ncbi:MAG: hypothetical protein O2887_06500 [Bacteroidetes bacterium]|nr:hypothetical protein [Bacteroidota bacterium]MDA1120132.1 hypothetical protein [Bacteroidota bacterium]